MRILRYIIGFIAGGAAGFALAILVATLIGVLAPAEHGLRGFFGMLVAFIAVPGLATAGAVMLGRRGQNGAPPPAL